MYLTVSVLLNQCSIYLYVVGPKLEGLTSSSLNVSVCEKGVIFNMCLLINNFLLYNIRNNLAICNRSRGMGLERVFCLAFDVS